MYAHIKTRLYDRMTDPGFVWIQGRLAYGNGRCALGCLYDMAAEEKIISADWSARLSLGGLATETSRKVYAFAGLNAPEAGDLADYNDHTATTPIDVAEYIKREIPDTI